jgi:hypothetical protein
MSTKLVKKLLQQTNRPLNSADEDEAKRTVQSRKRKAAVKSSSMKDVTKEDMLQSHIQSILRLDHKIQTAASTVAQKSFSRHSTNMKKNKTTALKSKQSASGVSNSRNSTSSFQKRRHEPTYDKVKARKKSEKDYYESVAKALRKAEKKRKIT